MQWRPSPNEFSPHEVVVHCADSELNGHMRIRYLVAEPEPRLIGYNEAAWPSILGYPAHPLDLALAAIEAARANTVPLLHRLPDEAWERAGTHSESGPYTATDWLRIYAAHLEEHAAQIDAIMQAWERR